MGKTTDLMFRYWGKAKPQNDGPAYHLLPYHCLDVAAVAQTLCQSGCINQAILGGMLGLPNPQFIGLLAFFAALHDLGKFSRAFQGLVPNLSPNLVMPDSSKHYTERHDTLGWLVWSDALADESLDNILPNPPNSFWADWVRASVGHHGMPPRESARGGTLPLSAHDFFLAEDIAAIRVFVTETAALFLPEGLPTPDKIMRSVIKQHSWQIAGLMVLADWLGSNQKYFAYHADSSLSLDEYWKTVALPKAKEAVADAGLLPSPVKAFKNTRQLFDYLIAPTPLQEYAANVSIADGPQLFLLEDVTGAGKTEAALILAHRLMAQGQADGLYFALPTTATANQMYKRVGDVYRKMYADDANPSLILAHGSRELIDAYRLSITQPQDRNYEKTDPTATTQCNAWLADNRKKSLLADVGVGTLDQALLAVLPARHQSLRLLGLARKILVLDEIHSFDFYMCALLQRLLYAHAQQGGSAILLSATVPAELRNKLVNAFRAGSEQIGEELAEDSRYPLVTHVHQRIDTNTCQTREQLKRKVSVKMLSDDAAVIDLICNEAAKSRCVCWIRNTVEDARIAFKTLQTYIPPDKLMLFHSRYAMGDRLDIEDNVITIFGKKSSAEDRGGRVLVTSPILQESIDVDMDLMISDLAPIDLLIQRAGRLYRHVRDANGNIFENGIEQRPAPIFYIYGPEPTDTPSEHWYSAVFPKARYVYPDAGRLWLTQRALHVAGEIVTPGELGHPGAVRTLVEAVYGEKVSAQIPEALQKASLTEEGKTMAEISQAAFNSLDLDKGYCAESSRLWNEEVRIPTRLGDETVTVYLALLHEDVLQPFIPAERFAWEMSAVRLDARKLKALAPEWERRFASSISELRERYKLLAEPAVIIPLEPKASTGQWRALGLDGRGALVEVWYDKALGLIAEANNAAV